ncbi:MAG: hypothetical protein CL840_01540 [Crocinitomicaceae bacterium]|nr:hypothetical protein [Crocinitomicaceae bacterium]|tara:strand:- start:5005 stop:5742 length:738 start_codon:yes stop_codon:yes gene_type:complete
MKKIIVALTIGFYSVSGIGQSLFINEVLAVNKTAVKNQEGKYEDWIEIYNGSSENMNVGGYFLSDDKTMLSKWAIPKNVIIKSKGFLLVLADNQPNKGGFHTNFKLSSKGETLYLSDKQGNLIHKLKFKRQYRDISYGLFPDGGTEKRYMNVSIGKKNLSTQVLGFDYTKANKQKIKLHVNAEKSGFVVYNDTGEMVRVILRNSKDQVFHRSKIEDQTGMIDLGGLEPGKYELQIGKNIYKIVKQ